MHTKLGDLLGHWAVQRHATMRKLPTRTKAQRAVYWKVSKKLDKRIAGRAHRVAHRLTALSINAARARALGGAL